MSIGGAGARGASARRVPGESGVWVFVLGDLVAFAMIFGALVWLQASDPATYERGQGHLHVELGLLNTVMLLTSSLLVARGVQATRGADLATARRCFSGVLLFGALFATVKGIEYTLLLLDGNGPRDSEFAAYYFGFTGLHLLHVAIGLAVVTGARRICARPSVDAHDRMMVEVAAIYWHVVDVLWIVLFTLLYVLG